jgi:hypothetical protein
VAGLGPAIAWPVAGAFFAYRPYGTTDRFLALTNLLPIKFLRSFPNQPDGSLDTFVAQALFYSSDRMSAS